MKTAKASSDAVEATQRGARFRRREVDEASPDVLEVPPLPGFKGGTVHWPEGGPSLGEFKGKVLGEGARHFRALPWRYVDDPYAVLVSEVMLQQTQVKRVLGYWERFLSAFPTVDALAAASVSDVLELWQGLGYNRRALGLKRAAEQCSASFGGTLPKSYEALMTLPGIGPATAAGVLAFAFRQPGVYLETNVRTVFIHELFPLSDGVSDKELVPLIAASCPPACAGDARPGFPGAGHRDALMAPMAGEALAMPADPRRWYYALLDYGAYLKSVLPNPSRRSAHHSRQSAFEGSRRQKRAWLLRYVLAADGAVDAEEALCALNEAEGALGRDPVDVEEFRSIVDDMICEGFFTREGSKLLSV